MRSILLLAAPLLCASAPRVSPPPDPAPRLVVLLSIDQLIPEQLTRLEPWLDGGLGRLARQGLRFESARLDYSMTATGPGHATLSTGCLPRTHGIVGNSMFDRETRGVVYCMSSSTTRAVDERGVGVGERRSTENMRVPTLGDRLKARDPSSKVVSIAGKDRSALALAGHAADGAYWWSRRRGGFVSTDQYGDALPEWTAAVRANWLAAANGWIWEPVFDLEHPPSGTAPDERDGETPKGEFGVTFPYVLPEFSDVDQLEDAQRQALASSVFGCPLADRFVVDLAMDAVRAMELGVDDAPDVLALGLSMCDVVGHGYGPYSHEVTDVLLRADDALGELFDLLDEQVGAGRWVAALSADHGVLPLPEKLRAEGVAARRVTGKESAALRRSVAGRLKSEFGEDFGLSYALFAFSIDEAAVRAAGLEPAEVRTVIADEAARTDWVRAAFTLEELRDTGATSDPMLRLFRNSSSPGRTPGVMLLKEKWHLVAMGKGTSHGSAHDYDRRIPLVFYGPGFAAGVRGDACGSEDVLPTLFAALGYEVPAGIDGENLVER